MKRTASIFLLTIFCLGAMAQEVVQWRGPNRDGIYNETGILKKWPDGGPKLLWHYDALGDGHTSAAVTSKAVFITGMVNNQGWVYSFDLSGKLLWKKEYGQEWAESHNGVRSTPLIVKDKLYVMSPYGLLTCMSIADGKAVWSIDLMKQYGARNITWGMTENLFFEGNVLYCTPGGQDAPIVALDLTTGKEIWKGSGIDEKSAYCSPLMITVQNRKELVTIMQNSICAFDPANGKLIWKFPFVKSPDVHPNTPVYIDGYLFCTSGYGLGSVMLKLAADGSSVTEVWKDITCDPKMGGVVVLKGRIYGAGDRNKKFFILDWKTGKEIYQTRNLAPANVIANDGLIYIYSESGIISLAEPTETGINIISSFSVPFGTMTHWAHPVIKDKKLYVRHGTSLMVYDVAAK